MSLRGRAPLPGGLVALLILVALLPEAHRARAAGPPARAAADEAAPGRWGLGWIDEGVTLRVAPADGWELEAAGGPRDWRVDSSRMVRGLDDGELVEYREPRLETRESGWVRLFASRRLMRHGRLSLALAAGGEHGWADAQTRRFYYRPSEDDYRTVLRDSYERDWTAIVALRPRYRLLRRATVEFSFGFAYDWRNDEFDEHDEDPGSQSWEHVRVSEDGRAFGTWGGWYGLGSLGFMFWF